MNINDYTREEKDRALDEAWEMMNPKSSLYSETETTNWQKLLDKRNALIARAEIIGLPLGNPHNAKLKDLERYVVNGERRCRNES